MSTHYKFEHDFDIDAKAYWDLFFSEDYNKDLYAELKMKEHKILEQREEGGKLFRSVKITPQKEVPAVFRAVISDMSYTERDVFHRDRSSMDVIIEPALMRDRFDMKGVYSVKSTGEGKCKRTFEGDVKVSVMLLGGKIEKYMIDEMRASYDIATRVTRKWIDKRKADKPAT